MLSFAFNWYVGSDHVVGYHIVNLIDPSADSLFSLSDDIQPFKCTQSQRSISRKRRFYCAISGRALGDSSHSNPGGNLHRPADGKHGRHVLRIRPLLLHKSQAGIIKKIQDHFVFGLRIKLSARAWIKRKYGHTADCTGLD